MKEFKVGLGNSPILEEFQGEYETTQKAEKGSERELDSDYICSFTTEPLLDAVKTPCGHVFNRLHLVQWLSNHNETCPNCRAEVKVEDLSDDHVVINKTRHDLEL